MLNPRAPPFELRPHILNYIRLYPTMRFPTPFHVLQNSSPILYNSALLLHPSLRPPPLPFLPTIPNDGSDKKSCEEEATEEPSNHDVTKNVSRRCRCFHEDEQSSKSSHYFPAKNGLVWVPKKSLRPLSFDFGESAQKNDWRTTVMIRNIPNKIRLMLMELLDKHCVEENEKVKLCPNAVESEYDFIYLPVDFKNHCNLGYAFVNLTTPAAARRLYNLLHKFKWHTFGSKKVCEITYARIQGKKALVEHFRKSYFKCERDEYLPIQFSTPRNGSTSCSSNPTVLGRRLTPPTSSSPPY